MKRKRILECIRQGKIGGGESHLLSLVENLDRNHYEPVVLSFTDGPMMERLEEMDIPSHIIHTEKPFDIFKWKKVRAFLKKQQIDLVHAHGTRACSNVLWAARSLDIPVIYTVHGWSFHQDQHPLVQKMRVWGEKHLTSRTAANISVSASNRASGVSFLKKFDSVVINNGINQAKFTPDRKLNDVRNELGIDRDAFLVLFIARFTSHKQPLTLIKAFAELLHSNPSARLLMVGDGDQKEEAFRLVKDLSVSDAVIFEPFRQDVPDVLAAADVFVLPSLWEGLPIGLLEAMAMGKPVIATNVDGTREVVENNTNGLLIEAGSVDALKNALIALASDEEERRRFGKNAMTTINERFNARNMTKEIESLYAASINQKQANK